MSVKEFDLTALGLKLIVFVSEFLFNSNMWLLLHIFHIKLLLHQRQLILQFLHLLLQCFISYFCRLERSIKILLLLLQIFLFLLLSLFHSFNCELKLMVELLLEVYFPLKWIIDVPLLFQSVIGFKSDIGFFLGVFFKIEFFTFDCYYFGLEFLIQSNLVIDFLRQLLQQPLIFIDSVIILIMELIQLFIFIRNLFFCNLSSFNRLS